MGMINIFSEYLLPRQKKDVNVHFGVALVSRCLFKVLRTFMGFVSKTQTRKMIKELQRYANNDRAHMQCVCVWMDNSEYIDA